jgi:2-polyprenyl-3-methyl-5-hydroxy-6-metoxy-1,4-benzoquinol methylase
MSGLIVEEFWVLGGYPYPFYRYVIENCYSKFPKKRRCLMLDAGCGPQICSLSKIPKNITVIGLDVDRKNIYSSHEGAKKKGYNNFHFIVGSLTSIPLISSIFDICVCVDVLEHLSDKKNAITEISRVCKPQAGFIGSTSNSLNPILLFDSIAPKRVVKVITEMFAPGHYERHRRLNPKSLIRILKDSNFHIQNIKLLGFPPFQPWLYHYSQKKIPIYAYLWILLDKITNKNPLNLLKEVIIFSAIKRSNIKQEF